MTEPSTKSLTSKNPDVVKLIAIADPHLSSTSPESWKADYPAVVAATIEQVLLFGVKEGVDAIVWAGDLFHRKSASRNPLGFIEDVMKLLKKTGILNVGVAGNHDLKWSSLVGLEGQPLSLLIEAGVYQLLDREELLINANGFSVRVAGASFEHGQAEGCRSKKKQGATYLISVGHFWFGKHDGEYNNEPLWSPDYLAKGEADVYVLGHKHDDQGVVEQDGKTYVVQGSISLTGERPSDSERRPAAAYIRYTKEGLDVKLLRPKVPPITELIDMEKREQLVQESHAMEEFVADISVAKMVGMDPREILSSMDLPTEVRMKSQFYLDLAGRIREV